MMATPVTAANFTLAGWGAGATLTNVLNVLNRTSVTITAGGGATITPVVNFIYPDGPYPISPLSLAWMIGGTGQVSDISVDRDSFITSTGFIYQGLPVAGKTYILMLDTLGI